MPGRHDRHVPAGDLAAMAAAELMVLPVATLDAEHPTEPGTLVSLRYVDQPHHEWPDWRREFSIGCVALAVQGTVSRSALRSPKGMPARRSLI
jgi:hypothetical protein